MHQKRSSSVFVHATGVCYICKHQLSQHFVTMRPRLGDRDEPRHQGEKAELRYPKNCFEAALNLASRTTSLSMPQHACGLQQCDILPTACTLMMTHWWWQYDTLMVNNFTKINVYWPVYWASSGCSYCHVLHEPMSQVMVVCGHSQTSLEGETYRPETPTSPLNCILDIL